MTSPYHFYFVVVPRRTSNLSEVIFGEIVVLKQIFVMYYKNSWKFSGYIFLFCDFLSICPGLFPNFHYIFTFRFEQQKTLKKSIFVICSVLTDFCHYLCLPLDRFLFEFFWSEDFWGSCYSSICFICGVFELKSEPKGWFTIMLILILLIELCEVLYEGSFQV
jgi:hypothetical protein